MKASALKFLKKINETKQFFYVFAIYAIKMENYFHSCSSKLRQTNRKRDERGRRVGSSCKQRIRQGIVTDALADLITEQI